MHRFYIYKSAKPIPPYFDCNPSVELFHGSAGAQIVVQLVNPRQFLYNLNHLIHRGFTFHSTAIIDL